MNALDYLVISIVIVWIVAAICFMVRAKKKGKRGCCGGCSSCSASCKKSFPKK